ncbi:MAG: NTP transferase domain-containing protein [Anaerolineae bacterium]|nr:NTP transferase domain-containing protein [Anaerolineae bacterium]
MIQQAVILAAGRGTRLGMLTKDRPKSMLPVLGKPIMVRVMDRLRDAGIRRFVVVIGEYDGGVASYLNSSWYPDTEVKFAAQTVATGTVDALTLAAPHIDSPFVLSAVDNITSLDHVKTLIAHFNRNPDQIASLSLLPASPEQIRKSSDVVIREDLIVDIVEKPRQPRGSFASIMLYAFSPDLFDFLPHVQISSRGEREIVSALQLSLQAGRTIGYTVTESRLHLTRELDLLEINRRYLQEGRDAHILSEIPGSVHLIPPVRIDPNVSVGRNAHIGPNVYLETGSTIGQGAILQDTLVLNGASVPAHEVCQGQIVDRNVRISEPQGES